MRYLAVILVLVAAATAAYFASGPKSQWQRISERMGDEAISGTPLLKPGMPEAEVFRTLGLDNHGLQARSSGSGPPTGWPSWYLVNRHRAIMIRWNLMNNPPTLVSVRVEPLDRDRYTH